MIQVEEARRLILERVTRLEAEPTPLILARGRILRTAATADLDSPPFDASAMDGYAARRADLGSPLRLVGAAPAGAAFAGTVGPGECVRVFTGAPVPAGADCVIRQEDTARDGDHVRITNTGRRLTSSAGGARTGAPATSSCRPAPASVRRNWPRLRRTA